MAAAMATPFTSELKQLASLIEIVTTDGHRVSTSAHDATGEAGPNVRFGCDTGGAYVTQYGGKRMSLDETRELIADLSNAIFHARSMEFARERNL